MSMSQEEIEALMSGADDITQDEEISEDTKSNSEEEISDELDENQDADDLLAGIDGIVDDESSSKDSENEEENSSETENLDDLLAGIDGIVDDESSSDDSVEKEENIPAKKDNSSNDNLEKMVEKNQYPLPAKPENKVVNQLNEVAEDSEAKASQIFDVLSFILDENSEIQNYNKKMGEFIEKQANLLDSLKNKFPNIAVFSENLELANELPALSKEISSKIDSENNKVFEAMELMQFHDINRQKIERVMAVIKKLNSYLNGIFEDDSTKPDVQIAQHISGDSTDNVVDDDDLEALISEFAK